MTERGGRVVVITQRLGQFPHTPSMVVALHISRIDNEVGSGERCLPVGGLREAQVGSKLPAVSLGQASDVPQPLGVDIHEGHMAALQVLGQAEIFHQAKGKCRTAGANHRDVDIACHGLVPVLT